jgi:hypothetical protein
VTTPEPQEDGQEAKKPGELSRAGKVTVSVVALAILAPFVAILWAWAAHVVEFLSGGAW